MKRFSIFKSSKLGFWYFIDRHCLYVRSFETWQEAWNFLNYEYPT